MEHNVEHSCSAAVGQWREVVAQRSARSSSSMPRAVSRQRAKLQFGLARPGGEWETEEGAKNHMNQILHHLRTVCFLTFSTCQYYAHLMNIGPSPECQITSQEQDFHHKHITRHSEKNVHVTKQLE